MMSKERGGAQIDEPGEATMTPEEEARWKRWDAALDSIIKHREDMERRGALLTREEIRQALDEMRRQWRVGSQSIRACSPTP